MFKRGGDEEVCWTDADVVGDIESSPALYHENVDTTYTFPFVSLEHLRVSQLP
jgi:hypothetical protein